MWCRRGCIEERLARMWASGHEESVSPDARVARDEKITVLYVVSDDAAMGRGDLDTRQRDPGSAPALPHALSNSSGTRWGFNVFGSNQSLLYSTVQHGNIAWTAFRHDQRLILRYYGRPFTHLSSSRIASTKASCWFCASQVSWTSLPPHIRRQQH